jgi:serine protease Do
VAPPAPPGPSARASRGGGAPSSFADLAATADPAIVFVDTVEERAPTPGSRRVVREGLGSAFVYDPNGLILTNNHVVEGATEIRVKFQDGRALAASVVGRDPKTDVAVLRVDAKGLPHLPLGNSDAVRVGDWVVAIGNPFGLAHTVSAGIISAKGRTGQDVKGLGDPSGYFNFLQTDASINPGNSGGPLLDVLGNVVGINTAIRAEANNIGFAIPINMVRELLPRLISDGKVRRSAIGIHVAGLKPEDVERLNLGSTHGALVMRVLPGGPADRAGLQVDDVIVGFSGAPIAGPEELRWKASLAGIGQAVRVRVARGKRTLELSVTLSELDAEPSP